MSGLISCDLQTVIDTVIQFYPDQSVLLAGPHGVGKSEAVYQVAAMLRDDVYKNPETCAKVGQLLQNEGKMGDLIRENGGVWKYEFGLPVIERRLSQMSEGELTGIPHREANTLIGRETTVFTQMDFMAVTYDFPVLLFFDEINRAFTSLRQGTFQIADSKIFMGNKLHSNTRVYVAANIGPLYQAEDFDIAEFSRYAAFMVNYNTEAWLKWAERPGSRVHNLVTSYITKVQDALFVTGNNFQANNKYPDPRAWAKLGRWMTRKEEEKLLADIINQGTLLYVASSIIGQEEGAKFSTYCKENAFFYGVMDILNDWPVITKKLPSKKTHEGQRSQLIGELFHKVIKAYENIDLTVLMSTEEHHYRNLKSFLDEVPDELISKLSQTHLMVSGSESIKADLKRNENSLMKRLFADLKKYAQASLGKGPIANK